MPVTRAIAAVALVLACGYGALATGLAGWALVAFGVLLYWVAFMHVAYTVMALPVVAALLWTEHLVLRRRAGVSVRA